MFSLQCIFMWIFFGWKKNINKNILCHITTISTSKLMLPILWVYGVKMVWIDTCELKSVFFLIGMTNWWRINRVCFSQRIKLNISLRNYLCAKRIKCVYVCRGNNLFYFIFLSKEKFLLALCFRLLCCRYIHGIENMSWKIYSKTKIESSTNFPKLNQWDLMCFGCVLITYR